MKGERIPELMRDHPFESLGLALVAGGFVITLIAWTGVRTTNNVAAQIPVILSGALVAIGLFVLGGALIVAGTISTRLPQKGSGASRYAWLGSNGQDSAAPVDADGDAEEIGSLL